MDGISRRRVLASLGLGAASIVVAACARATATPPLKSIAPTPTPSDRPTASPTAQAPSPTPNPSPTPSAAADLTLDAKVAQMLLVGFRGAKLSAAAATVADIRDRGLGGVLLFDYDSLTERYDRNIRSPDQLRTLVGGLRDAATVPLLVAIDEEGGRVDRLKASYGFPKTLSAADLGKRDDPAFTRAHGKAIGRTLAGLGIGLDLAPVVDVDVNPTNPIIGALDRSFSADPSVVAEQGRAFLDGLQAAGVAGALKHFPGHGSSTADTHLGWVDVTSTWTEAELGPFRDVIAAGPVDAVLVAHVFDSKLDRTYPASLSKKVVTGMLREGLGFDGVVISDDLQMGAIRSAFGYKTAVERAILAGTDILTIANQQVYEHHVVARTIGIVMDAVAAGRITEARIDESWQRIRRLKGL